MNGQLDLLSSWRQALSSLILSIFSLAAMLSSAHAETPYQPQLIDCLSESWRWREFPQVKGRGLNCLSEGPDGEMWFGVDGGALRYNGLEWTEFGRNTGLRSTALAFASTGDDFFAATSSAVFALKNEAWVELFPGNSDRVWIIEDLIAARDGSLWAATNWGAVHMEGISLPRESQTWTLYATSQIVDYFEADHSTRFKTVVVETPDRKSWKQGLGLYVYGPIPNGQTIIGIAEDGPAAKAGLKVGDQIVELNGEERLTVYQTEVDSDNSEPIRLVVKPAGSNESINLSLTPVELDGRFDLFRPYSLAEGTDGTIWFATRLGNIISLESPAKKNHPGWKNHTREHDLPKIAVPSIAVTARGIAGSGRSSNDRALLEYDGQTWNVREVQRSICSSITSLSDERLLVGALGAVLSVDKRSSSVLSTKQYGLTGVDLIVKQTSDEGIWIGGKGSTVYRIEPQYRSWTSYEGIIYQATDKKGKEWFLSHRLTVVSHEGENWREYDSTDGLISVPTSVLVTESGDVWVAGSHNGHAATARLADGKWDLTEHPKLSWAIDRRSPFEDRDGRVWFGAASISKTQDQMLGGVIRFDGMHWTHIEPTNRLTYVYQMCQTADGSVWAGGQSLVQILPNDQLGPSTLVPGKAHGYCDACVSDLDGNLWVGTRSQGLMRMTQHEDGKWSNQWFDENGQLSSNSIQGVVPLSDKSLFAYTSEAFHRFDGKNWSQSSLPQQLASMIDVFGLQQSEDGALWLNSSSIGVLTQESVSKGKYASTQRDAFRTWRYVPDWRPPETHLESRTSELVVGNDATFLLNGVDPWNVTAPSQLTYSYRVNKQEWSPFSESNVVTLSGLPSGSYQIEARSRDRDFNIDESPIVSSFQVIPLLIDRTWFRGLMLFTLGAFGIAVVQTTRVFRREAKLRVTNQELRAAEGNLQLANSRLEERVVERTNELQVSNQQLLREIDERTEAESKLRESEQRFRTMFEQAAVGVAQLDSQTGRILRVNKRSCEIAGLPEAEILNKTWMELTHSEDLEADQALASQFINNEIREFSIEKRLRRPDGTYAWIDLSLSAMWRPGEPATELIAIVQDISTRKQADEERLRGHLSLVKLDETVRSLFKSVRSTRPFFDSVCQDIESLIETDLCAVPLVDVSGESFTYKAARGKKSALLLDKSIPISQGGLCGWIIQNLDTLCVPDLSKDARVLPDLAKALEVTSAVLAPLIINGKVIGGLSVFRNGKPFSDSELRTLNLYSQSVSAAYENRLTLSSLEQRVVERTNELAETNAELESFARTVSHDLRAPLRAMEGFAAALAEDYGQQVDAEGREYIQHIIDSAKRLDGMVADLLAYSRLGRTELRITSLALNDVVHEAMNRLRGEITSQSAVITVAENMPTILGHKSTLAQVVTNLLSNALKFVAKNTRPEVRIWATTTTIGMVRLTVQDNGIGVETAYQKRIFQVFERLHGIESYPGTGIGLAIVARACERLGGSCGMESNHGHGSQFWVEFPKGTVGK
jgi:PAS domain S-box-containing protein